MSLSVDYVSADRIEAEFTVPASTTVTASVANGAAASTVTLTAGATFLTDFLEDFETQLNDNVQGYPQSAAAMAAVLGGTWTSGAGWLCNESSGSLIAVFGSPNLTAVSSPLYGVAGPRGGIDLAVDFDSTDDAFSGGNVFDVGATDDLIVAWVAKATSATNFDIAGKWSGAPGYLLVCETTYYRIFVSDGADGAAADATGIALNEWHVGVAVLERATNKLRIATKTLAGVASTSAETDAAAVGSLSNAANFRLGDQDTYGAASTGPVAALWVVKGSGVATGLSAGLATAVSNLAAAINASWSVTQSATTGQVSIGYSSPPAGAPSFAIDWGSSTLREFVGFEYDLNYPDTAAELAALIGRGTWSAGWLCNETSGSLAAAFGSPSLTAVGSPTYSNLGPRGGADLAVGFDSAADAFEGADSFDVDGTSDLCLMWVGKITATPSATNMLFVKGNAGAARWTAWFSATTANLNFEVVTASGTRSVAVSALSTVGSWHVGMVVIDRASGTIRAGVCPLGGSPLVSSTAALFAGETMANADSFTVGNRSGAAPALNTLLAAVYIGTGASVAAGMSASLSTALSNFAATFGTWTSGAAAKSCWASGCNVAMDSDPSQAPKGDDGRASIGPTGETYGIVTNSYYRHRNVRYPLVARNKVWASAATYENEDWETFYLDTQRGQHAWFSPYSRVQVYWDSAGTATLMGAGTPSAGWRMPAPVRLDELKMYEDRYTGLFEIRLGDLFGKVV